MNDVIDELVSRFDRGTLVAPTLDPRADGARGRGRAPRAAAQATPFRSTRIDHISIQVTDMARSIAFYEKIFGLKVLNEDKENEIVRMGVTRIIVSLHRKPPVGIVDHFAIAIDDFNREAVTAELAKHGLTPSRTSTTDSSCAIPKACRCRSSAPERNLRRRLPLTRAAATLHTAGGSMSRSVRFLLNAALCLLVGGHAVYWFAMGRADSPRTRASASSSRKPSSVLPERSGSSCARVAFRAEGAACH